jgi:hypothetical protein
VNAKKDAIIMPMRAEKRFAINEITHACMNELIFFDRVAMYMHKEYKRKPAVIIIILDASLLFKKR